MTVVTMWVPFSRYISAAPLRARLIESVPPEVKTISLGSRAPTNRAMCARAASQAPSASHPKGWLRLAGWPNFSVKYGSIASTTRGSQGVVDCASRKMGNFTAMDRLSSHSSLDRQQRRHVLGDELGQAHRVQHLGDGGLDLLHRAPQVAPLHLRTVRILQTAHDVDRSFERADHLSHGDLARPPRQDIAPLGAVLADDEPLAGQLLEDFREQLRRDSELLGDSLGADGTAVLVDRDVVNRHQPVV